MVAGTEFSRERRNHTQQKGFFSYVLMSTRTGAFPYLTPRSAFNHKASRPLRADILSAKRQLIGILGFRLPEYWMAVASAAAFRGLLDWRRGFCRIPWCKRARVASGTE